MPEMTIRLETDAATGKKNIIVSLRADEDSLPHEHEQMHRALVERLLQGGLVKASELGQIIVEREEVEAEPAQPKQTPAATERQTQAGAE